MDETARRDFAKRVAAICEELATWTADSIMRVDGNQISDLCLAQRNDHDLSPQNVMHRCQELGMDYSVFCFYHCDLGPGNIIVGGERIGILDWETASLFQKNGFEPSSRYPAGWTFRRIQSHDCTGGDGSN